MKALVSMLVAVFALSTYAPAQLKEDIGDTIKRNLGVSGGWVYMTGDGSLNGFNAGAEMRVVSPVAIGFDWDNGWANQNLGVFQFTSIGAIATHSHLQNWIIGPRVYFPGTKVFKKSPLKRLSPFLEAQFGESRLTQKVTSAATGSVSATATDFTWELGGGGDILLNRHWSFRPRLDWLRTHFASSGQSHLRLSVGLMYTLWPRKKS